MNFKSRSINQFQVVCHHILCNRNLACNRIFRQMKIYPFDDRRIKSDLRTIFALIKNMIKNEFTKRIAQGNSIILAISPPTIALASREKKNPCLLSLCLATLCPRDTHLIAPLFVAPSRTSLKFVGFEEEERRLGLVPLVSISRQRRDVVYNLHQVSLSCPIISSSVSCTWLFLLLLPFNTERLPPINLYWKFNTERERERERYIYMNSIYK